VKLTPLLATPPAVTTTFPVVAPAGTGTVIEPEVQFVGIAAVPLKVTEPGVEPKLVPEIVTVVPTAPEVGDKPVMFGTTVNCAALLAIPPTVTTTVPLPAVAALGTGTVIDEALQFVGDAFTPLNMTVLVPCEPPNPVPVIVMAAPAMPEVADKLVILGATVNVTPLLATPPTVTITLPLAAPFGTATVIEPEAQAVGVAIVPLKATVLLPWLAPKPVPVTVIKEPIVPEVADRALIFGTTVKGDPLLAVPPTVTTTAPLPPVAAAGTDAVMDEGLQLDALADTPLKVIVLLPCWLPNPEPVIVTAAPAMPDAVDRLVMLGTTVKADPLLATPLTVTTTRPLPPVAPTGTGAVIDEALQLVGVVATPLNVAVLLPCELPNPEPVIVTEVPAIPDVVERLVMLGCTVNATPLLAPPATATTTLPVVAAAGTVVVIEGFPTRRCCRHPVERYCAAALRTGKARPRDGHRSSHQARR